MDKRKQLLKLIEELKVNMTPQEAADHVANLSDEEVDLLIKTYTDANSYEDAVNDLLERVDPEGLEKLENEHQERQRKEYNKYLDNLENLQKDSDKQMDRDESDANEAIEKIEQNREETLSLLEDSYEQLYNDMKSVVNPSD